MSGAHLSKDFFELVKAIGEAKSKQEEDRIILSEVKTLKQKMSEPDVPRKKQRELLVRMVYCEMMGHEASFGYIHAVNLAHEGGIYEKRVGYLAVTLCLHQDHELMILLVNTLHRDLKSANQLEVCAALTAVCKLINADTIPAVQQNVVDLLNHPSEMVRKKAVMALHSFYRKSKNSVSDLTDQFRRALCDRDPSVMCASLNILYDLAVDSPAKYKDLIPSFVSILKQVVEHRLPRDFDYHRVPAPWIQMKLLRVLAVLGTSDQRGSEGMYEILNEVIRKADTGINIGYAIIYECVRTITTIYPNSTILETAANSISRFITSDSHNLKYMGITALANIVLVNPKYAAEHQMIVIDCLESSDETLRRKTVDLLYRMTNPVNCVVVVDKLLGFLKSTSDVYMRTELVQRLTQLAEKFAPNNQWFITTMNTVFELGGEMVRPETAHNLMRLIAEGSGEDDEEDLELRRYAVDAYMELLEKPVLPDILIHVVCWVLGEYGYLSTMYTPADICDRLSAVMTRQLQEGPDTRGWIINALTKLAAQTGNLSDSVQGVILQYANSRSLDLQQRCYEFMELYKTPNFMKNVLPQDASCEDLEPDPDLEFLDGFVGEARARGAKEYMPPGERNANGDSDSDDDKLAMGVSLVGDQNQGSGLRFGAYEKPSMPGAPGNYNLPPSLPNQNAQYGSNPGAAPAEPARTTGLNVGNVQRKWGPEGFNGPEAQPAQAAAAVPPPARPAFGAAPDAARPPSPSREMAGLQQVQAKAQGASTAPAEPSAKEKLAASLFGGLSVGDDKPAKKEKKERKEKKDKDKPKSAPASSGGGDLLDLSDDTFSAPPPQPGAAAPAHAGPKVADDIMSLFDSAVSSVSSTGGGGGMGGALSGPAVGAGSAGGRVDPTKVPLPPGLAGVLGNSPRGFKEVVAAGGDHNLEIFHNKIFGDNELLVLMQYTNQSGAPLKTVNSRLDFPPSLQVEFGGEPMPSVVAHNTIMMTTVGPRSSVFLLAKIQLSAASNYNGMFLKGVITYLDTVVNANHEISFNVPIHLSDLVRPHTISTNEFGAMWGSHSAERKVSVPSSIRSVAEYQVGINRRLNMHPVQAIGTEVISSGKVVVGSTMSVVLIHTKVGGPSLEMTVRSQAKEITDTLASQCSAVMK